MKPLWEGLRVAVLTASDAAARGEREDVSGATLCELARGAGAGVLAHEIVADERAGIAAVLVRYADELGADVVLTTGGTGIAARDVTPDATADVADRLVPGIAEALRAASLAATPHAMLTRGLAAIRGATLIVNLPGSPAAVRETFAVLAPAIPHAVALLRGEARAAEHRAAGDGAAGDGAPGGRGAPGGDVP